MSNLDNKKTIGDRIAEHKYATCTGKTLPGLLYYNLTLATSVFYYKDVADEGVLNKGRLFWIYK